ncbi:MAG: type VI secretion system tip protein VgrG [Acidobacteriia bacterium]|nr:type VI secretion system tip protein VgrG [Terriglobia bacterium]
MPTYVQANSPILITTPLGPDKFLVKSFQGEERLSEPFRFTLELLSEDNAIDFSQIVGNSVTLTISLASGDKQYLNGIVGRFVQAGSHSRFTTYHAEVHPWLWLLTMNSDCRIFQNMTTPDVIKKVFFDAGFTDVTDSLTATYSPREYCVQYMESSFAFVSRLMEEEGIFYFFVHGSSSHKLVLADDVSAYQTCPGLRTATMQKEAWAAEDIVTSCTLEQQVVVGRYKADDYNFLTPRTDLLATANGSDSKRTVYEYPGLYSSASDGESRTSLRLSALEIPGKLLRGTSFCWAFRPGNTFTLSGHGRTDINAEYVLTRVSHSADQNVLYTNSFEAIPSSTIFRPPRITPRPIVHGPQTAVVAGRSGEEIWTDRYGRIIVQFHWDQVGQNDERSSCWIRVAQGWAGKQWGSFFLPRIGQEVVVSFLDGNPDRPLVTGCVYNATTTVPYTLPANQTRSTIKTNSSKGGSGFNELRFEDKAGSEEIFLQAQKDMNVTVLNDETVTIANNRTVTVQQKDDTLTVSQGNRTVRVSAGNETHEVQGTRAVTVTGDQIHTDKGNFTRTVSGNYSLKVSGNLSIDVSGSVMIKAGTSLTNQAGTSLANHAGTSLENKAGTSMTNEAQISLTNKAGACQILDGGGMLTIKGGLVKLN